MDLVFLYCFGAITLVRLFPRLRRVGLGLMSNLVQGLCFKHNRVLKTALVVEVLGGGVEGGRVDGIGQTRVTDLNYLHALAGGVPFARVLVSHGVAARSDIRLVFEALNELLLFELKQNASAHIANVLS